MNRREFIIGTALCGAFPEIIFASYKSLEQKLYPAYAEVAEKFEIGEEPVLIVDGRAQRIHLVNENGRFNIQKSYDVSTSKKGFSNVTNSFKTPTGIHRIYDKYGHEFPLGTLFSGNNVGKIVKINPMGREKVDMTGRVMQLEGCEEKNHNTLSRGVYIHGASSEGKIGEPASAGCVRMRNKEIIELYNLVSINTYVNIKEEI